MKQIYRMNWLAVVVFCCGLFPSSIEAQAVSGDVTGSVLDSTGATVQNATVTAENEATGVKATVQTTAEGAYRFTNLSVGSYTITAVAAGFSTATLKNVAVALNNVVTANLTVDVGKTSTTVEVSSAGATIDTTTAQVQTTFTATQVMDVPTASRGTGIWNLSLIGAGVSSQGGVGQGVGPSIAGQRPEDNVFNLDGVPNNDRYNTGPLVYTSNDAIAEVSLLQNQFSPEFGGGSGGVFNAIVKTGTNAMHGSLYEYFQNKNLNAVDSTLAVQGYTSNPRFDNNRLGATIGGPIIKNKFFYFGNFEYNPYGKINPPSSPVLAPTAAGVMALNNIPGLSKTNLAVFEKYVPAAAVANNSTPVVVNGVSIPTGSIPLSSPYWQNNYDAVVSLDYDVSDKDQLRGRWVYNRRSTLDATPQLTVFDVTTPNNNYLYSLSEFHNFGPTLQNELRTSFSRNYNEEGVPNISFPGLAAFPNLTIDELNSLNIGPSGPTGSIQNVFQASDNLSKIWGKHNIKVGYNFVDVILTNYFIQRVRGDYYWLTLGDYLNDLSPTDFGERSASPSNSYPAGFLQHEAFFNDDYRVLPNLTLNLGVRYEYVTEPVASRYQSYSALASVPGVFSVGTPKFSPNDWSPRIGFAYSPGGSGVWSIRGGFSRAFDLTYANLTSNGAPPYFQQTNDTNPDHITPGFLASGGLPAAAVALPNTQQGQLGVLGSYTFSKNRPYGLTYTLGVQRILKKDYTVELRYTGTKGVHLWNQTRLNIDSRVSASNYIPTYTTMPSAATLGSLTKTLAQVESYIVPGGTAALPANSLAIYGSQPNITAYAPQGYSQYNGLAFQLTKRFSNNFSYVAAYTWSHLIDDSTATNFSTYLTPRREQDFQNMAAEKASSALDHRQRFTFTPIYDWKPFASRNWFLKNLVGNWTASGTYTYESPEYATVQSGVDCNMNGDAAGDRAIINLAGNASLGSGVTPLTNTGAVSTVDATTVAYVANSANARYIVAGPGALANAGRNTFPLRPTDNIDASVSKNFNLTERVKLSFSAQFFNVLNHPQWTGGFLNDVASNSYTTSRNDLIPGNGYFGRFDQFYSSNSRTGQLTAHIAF